MSDEKTAYIQELSLGSQDIGGGLRDPGPLEHGSVLHDGAVARETKSTPADLQNMQRMGHRQQLIRNFKLLSTISFISIATANWEFTAFTLNQGLIDGGRAGLVWSYVWNFVGFLPIIMSLAEMSSMAPISGAQYHWVSEFAPVKYQKTLSYFTGWFSTLAWQAGNATGMFLAGTLIQTLIFINNENYSFPNWQGTLLVIATAAITLTTNIYGTKFLPQLQNFLFVFHTALYLCLLVPIWILAPRTSAKAVFTEFSNTGGWQSMDLAVFAGQLCGISAMTGIDTAVHMSEEIKDAGKNVPIAMMIAYALSFIFNMPLVITLCYAMPDLEAALGDPTEYPVVYILRQTMSVECVTAFISAIILILYFSNVAYLAAVSRDLFAFARDSGVPFAAWLSKVDAKRHIPVNALIASCAIAALLSLIYIGSSVAFYALVSLLVISILQCYMFSIASILWRRITAPETLPNASFSLGRWGIPINALALIYVVWAFFWSFWPQSYQPDAGDFNWASVLFGAVMIISSLYYVFWGRKTYKGPVVLVEDRDDARIL